MTSIFFSQLPVPDQAKLLAREGRFLSTRCEPEFIVDIYQVRGVYAEVYFSIVNENFIVIRSFYSDEGAAPSETQKPVFYKMQKGEKNPGFYSC